MFQRSCWVYFQRAWGVLSPWGGSRLAVTSISYVLEKESETERERERVCVFGSLFPFDPIRRKKSQRAETTSQRDSFSHLWTLGVSDDAGWTGDFPQETSGLAPARVKTWSPSVDPSWRLPKRRNTEMTHKMWNEVLKRDLKVFETAEREWSWWVTTCFI